jgi:hypothetical protein
MAIEIRICVISVIRVQKKRSVKITLGTKKEKWKYEPVPPIRRNFKHKLGSTALPRLQTCCKSGVFFKILPVFQVNFNWRYHPTPYICYG